MWCNGGGGLSLDDPGRPQFPTLELGVAALRFRRRLVPLELRDVTHLVGEVRCEAGVGEQLVHPRLGFGGRIALEEDLEVELLAKPGHTLDLLVRETVLRAYLRIEALHAHLVLVHPDERLVRHVALGFTEDDDDLVLLRGQTKIRQKVVMRVAVVLLDGSGSGDGRHEGGRRNGRYRTASGCQSVLLVGKTGGQRICPGRSIAKISPKVNAGCAPPLKY